MFLCEDGEIVLGNSSTKSALTSANGKLFSELKFLASQCHHHDKFYCSVSKITRFFVHGRQPGWVSQIGTPLGNGYERFCRNDKLNIIHSMSRLVALGVEMGGAEQP